MARLFLLAGFLTMTAAAISPMSPALARQNAVQTRLGSSHFIVDGNRIYARLAFVRPDGSIRPVLAFVDMGSPTLAVSAELLGRIRREPSDPVTLRIGAFPVSIDAASVTSDSERSGEVQGHKVEAVLGAKVLTKYQVVIDYLHRSLTLAAPGTLRPSGIPTPFQLDHDSGLIAVHASIGTQAYWVTIDNGSAWTWFRRADLDALLHRNSACRRSIGAVGASNMMMIGDLEASGVLARLPVIRIGGVSLKDVDALGPGPTTAFPFDLFDWYSRKNAVPVLGWIGGNVLKRFRLFIDYPTRTLYWQRQRPSDLNELNQVGLTLRRQQRRYFIAGVARKLSDPTVPLVKPGDELVRVNGRELYGVSLGMVYQALHGSPGERRELLLKRNGKFLRVSANVTAF